MKKWFLCIGLALFVGAFVGCKKDSSTEPDIEYTIENYYPLAVGNEWTYQCIRPCRRPPRKVDTSLYIAKIKESYEWEGREVFVREWIKLPDTTTYRKDYVMYWNDETVIAYWKPPEESEDTVALEEDAASSRGLGKEYTIPLWEPLVEENAWRGHKITRVYTTMRVAGKNFPHCIRIWYSPSMDFGAKTRPYPIFFAPGVGKIKWVPWKSDVWELVDYKVNKR